LLWASTSTKNPSYSDVKYVDSLIGPDTINTIPTETLNAYRDHGDPAVRLEDDLDEAYKVMQIYRQGCETSPRVEMHIADKDGKAMCVYGGAATTKAEDMSKKSDYIMWATDDHWARMGDGRDGPMKAMMFGRLHFKGPKMEAMGNMGPFAKFLLLTGKVDSDRSKCP